MKRILLCFLLLMGCFCVHAEVLGRWNLTSAVASPTVTSSNVVSTAIILSSGTIQYLSLPSSAYASTWSQLASFSPTGKYWQFSIQPILGKEMLLSSVTFDAGRTSAGPAAIQVQYSLDNFVTLGVNAGTFVNSSESTLNTFLLTNLPSSATTNSITFRIWGYNASSSGNFRLNNIIVNGEVSTLPISLTSFAAEPINKAILLSWKTASEKNNKSFELHRSADGKNFTTITTLERAGNSDSEKSYSFLDENPFSGTNYYKLVQYDANGQSTSKTISVDSKLETAQVFVSATNSSVDLNILSPNFTKAIIYLCDLEGSKIAEQALSLSKGSNVLKIAQSLTPGIYFVSLITDRSKVNAKFTKW